jgi:hypothetical protein
VFDLVMKLGPLLELRSGLAILDGKHSKLFAAAVGVLA